MSTNLRIGVIIASLGRPTEMGRWSEHIARQTLKPRQLIYSLTGQQDIDGDISSQSATVTFGSAGLCAQRNRGLLALEESVEIVAFFDDDYIPSRYCLEGIARFFSEYPDILGVTGSLLADGIKGPGTVYEDAMAMIAAHDATPRDMTIRQIKSFGLYGCNMAFRRSALAGLAFDEALPKYGWQEDVDLSRQVAKRGKICRTNAFTGVHQGVKHGRSSGIPLGYSQIANPIYLVRKRTMSMQVAGRTVFRNIVANLARSVRPEPWIDRRGRLKGNLIAIRDVLLRRDHPSRILDL